MLRHRAIDAIGLIGPGAEGAAPALTVALADVDPTIRTAAALALGRLGPKARRATKDLVQALHDADRRVCQAAVSALGELGPNPDVPVPVLVAMLVDPAIPDHTTVLVSLGKLGPEARHAAVQAIIDLLKSGRGDTRQRTEAVFALAERIDAQPEAKTILPILVTLLKDENISIRDGAVYALRKLGRADEVLPIYREALRSDAVDLRVGILDSLSLLGTKAKGMATAVREAMKDSNPVVRMAAARAQWQIEKPAKEVVSVLMELINDSQGDRNAGFMSIVTLTHIGPEAGPAVGVVAPLLRDPDAKKRHNALMVLAIIGPPASAALGDIMAVLKGPDPKFQKLAASVLGAIGPDARSAIPALRELQTSDDEEVAAAALEAIESIAGTP